MRAVLVADKDLAKAVLKYCYSRAWQEGQVIFIEGAPTGLAPAAENQIKDWLKQRVAPRQRGAITKTQQWTTLVEKVRGYLHMNFGAEGEIERDVEQAFDACKSGQCQHA